MANFHFDKKKARVAIFSGGVGALAACLAFVVLGYLIRLPVALQAAGALLFSLFAVGIAVSVLARETPSAVAQLARTIQDILKTRNGSARLEKGREDDEAGAVADAVNELLARLREQENKLEQHRKHVKDQVAFHTTDLRQANEQLTLAKREAELGSQSKSVFLANMSHELRTPLNAIIGYGEMLEEQAQDLGHEELLPDIRNISAAGKRLLEWVDQILDLSKIESGRTELRCRSFGVAEMAKETEADVLPVAREAGVALEVDLPPELGSMNADRDRVKNVLFNLLKSACKTTRQGPVSLRVSRESVEGVDWIQFDITDSSPGISPGLMKNLFKDYSQDDAANSSAYGGFALGLVICQRFSLLMGGNIFAETEPGKGSSTTLRLPAEVEAQLSKSYVIRGTNRLIRDLLNIPEGKI